MPDDKTILIFGHHEVLVRTRQMVLEQARYRVRTSFTAKEAICILNDPSSECDLFLICHSVKAPEKQEIEKAIAGLDVRVCHLDKLLYPTELIATAAQELS